MKTKNYYNDNDPFICGWVRNLIAMGLVPDGDVDERSIKDVQPQELKGYTQCHFFSGICGWSEALRLAGWPADRPVWTGSCPCQPFSDAGKRKGTADERHLWPEFYRLIAQCRPPVVFGEQVASEAGRGWLTGVRVDMEAVDYAVGAADLCSASKAAPDIRQRLWWLAESELFRIRGSGPAPNAEATRGVQGEDRKREWIRSDAGASRAALADGMEHATRNGRQQGRSESIGRGVASGRSLGRMGHSDVCESSQPQEQSAREECQTVAGAGWSAFAIAECSDGKQRRFEPGSFPLVAGIPVSMGRGRTRQQRMAIRAARANRVGRLKGYGNSICPQVAAEFIQAYLETRTT